MQIVDIFSGIGGFSLAGRWMGWNTVQFCEKEKFCQQVLKYHFPGVPISDDIKTLTADQIINNGLYDKNEPTIIVGGVPCQPWSQAGKRLGKADDRDLWEESIALIGSLRPRWAILENVRGLTNWNGGMVFDEVQADLEAKGYEVTPFLLPACAVNAPHRRDRIWFVAYAGGNVHKGGLDYGGNRSQKTGSKIENKQSIGRDENREWVRTEFGASSEATTNTGSIQLQGWAQIGDSENTAQERTGLDNRVERSSNVRDAADTDSDTWRGEKRELSPKQEQRRHLSEIQGVVSGRVITDTSSAGQQEHNSSSFTDKSGYRTRSDIENWTDWPTQSPVCNGNDEFSARLDGITFSKWRNESIKAGGNAVVPALVYQIFKAIEFYELLYTKTI